MPPRIPSNRSLPRPLIIETTLITDTDAAWMNTIRRNFGKSVTRRKVKTHTTYTFEKSRVREMAPPLHIGEIAEANSRTPIMLNR